MKVNKINFILFFTLLFIVIVFSSCGDDNNPTNSQATGDCGAHHTITKELPVDSFSNQFLGTGDIRTFQYSIGGIDNICTHGKPRLFWEAFYSNDNTRRLTIRGVARWHIFGADVPGTYDSSLSSLISWTGTYEVGLQQAFGEGPGNLSDVRVDVSFPTLGSPGADLDYMRQRFNFPNAKFTYNIEYEEYVAHADMLEGKFNINEFNFVFNTGEPKSGIDFIIPRVHKENGMFFIKEIL